MHSLGVKNIKITFLIFFLLLTLGFSLSIFAQENSSDKNIALDSDQDGLSDADEKTWGTDPKNPDTDGDGYSDGSETKSGYNPLKPAPGDKISDTDNSIQKTALATTDSDNMTQDISNQIAAMISESASGTDGVSMDKINSLIEEKISTKITFSELPEIDESTIKIKEQNYSGFGVEKQERKKKEDNEEYLSAIFYIMADHLPNSIASKDEISSFSDEIIAKIPSIATGDVEYFNDLAERGSEMLEKLSDIEVPIDMLEIHKRGLQLAIYAISLKEKVKINNADPIASIVSLSEVENIFTLGVDYLSEIEAKLEELDLTGFVMDQTATN